ncbi:MAG: GH25 family lysozyme [Eubacteriales bacterium]|nr:GH25 family lysozyme [Eubacteriales bacterium]
MKKQICSVMLALTFAVSSTLALAAELNGVVEETITAEEVAEETAPSGGETDETEEETNTVAVALSDEDEAAEAVVTESASEDPEEYRATHRTTEPEENQNNAAQRVMLFSNSTVKSIYTGKTYTVPAGKTITQGIDVSKWDGSITWSKVKAAGTDYAIIRAGYTGYGSGGQYTDDTYATNMKNAIAAGIPVGVYIYSQATTTSEAKKEAQFCLNAVKGYSIKLPIVMDVEFAEDSSGYTGRLYKAGLSKTQQTNICLAFCETIAAAGYTPMIYANKSMLTSNMNAATISAKYPIWMANYTTATSYTGDYTYWQYSETGTVSGISTAIDCNFAIQSGSSSGSSTAVAATKVTLNVTSVERACNRTKQLKATLTPSNASSTVTWKSSNTAIAKVSSTGKVTAVSPGKATITATAGSVSATCTVTVRPEKVTPVSLKKTTSNYYTLTWSKAAGASSYYIYRSTTGKSGSYSKIGSATGTSYTDKTAKTGKTYYYIVRGRKSVSGTAYMSVNSAAMSTAKIPAQTTIKTMSQTSTRRVKITWKAASRATRYYVYRSTTGKTGSYKLVKTVKGKTSYTSAKLTKGKTYYYRIVSVRYSTTSGARIRYKGKLRSKTIKIQ